MSNIVIVQQFFSKPEIVQFCVGFKFRTAECMRGVFWDVEPCAVVERLNVGVLYTVPSLTHSITLSLFLSLSLFYVA